MSRFENLPERLRETSDALWDTDMKFGHKLARCSTLEDAALKIEALERDLAIAVRVPRRIMGKQQRG